MSLAADDGLVAISDDELVEVHVTRASSTTSSRPNPASSIFNNLLNPQGVASRARATMESLFSLPGSGQSRRPSQPHVRPRPPHTTSQSAFPRSWTTTPESGVIDLTVEPDSPVERRRPQPSHNTHNTQPQPYMPPRNPRRTASQRISPPHLSRSDSTFVGQPASFIDLTADSPDDDQRPNRHAWRPQPPLPQPQRVQRQRRLHHRGHGHSTEEHLLALGYSPEFGSMDSFRRLAGLITGDMMLPAFTAHIPSSASQQHQEPPKPPLEPLPPAQPGFTRDTCTEADGEQVVICPACNEELAYDPADAPATPSKKRKRVAGEHHFWALKKCGHVFCADCFENRRPTKHAPNGAGFPSVPNKDGTSHDLLCAVEGCKTKVASKTEWVGIYL
ncbi:hypothetical protein MKX08_008071 [Trichoderma sp. CBMAI-0020]|nr:hypothetical protein MKX08_008071 [Trichoderma sp. CBMAI-0020]